MNVNIKFLFVLLILSIVFYYILYNLRKIKYRNLNLYLIRDGNLNLYMTEIEKYLRKVKRKEIKRMLLSNKVTGLIYKGSFQDALDILNSIGDRFKNEIWKVQYYSNYILILTLLGRVDDAINMYKINKDLFDSFEQNRKYKFFKESLQKLRGAIKFYQGEIAESKIIFKGLLSEQKYKLYTAMNHYYLGLIAEKENDMENSKYHFKKAQELGKGTFLENVY